MRVNNVNMYCSHELLYCFLAHAPNNFHIFVLDLPTFFSGVVEHESMSTNGTNGSTVEENKAEKRKADEISQNDVIIPLTEVKDIADIACECCEQGVL